MAQKMTRLTITPNMHQDITQAVDWDRQHAMTDDEIDRQNAADPDAVPLTESDSIALRVQWVRSQTGLSQPAFAEKYDIPVGTLRDWEQGRARPDAAALAYLRVIEHEPEAVQRALAAA